MTIVLPEQHFAGYTDAAGSDANRRYYLFLKSRRWRHGDPAGGKCDQALFQINQAFGVS